MRKRKTTEKLIKSLVEISDYGTLTQAFILEAIVKHSNLVAKSTPADYPEGSFIDPRAWIEIAENLKKKIEDNYND